VTRRARLRAHAAAVVAALALLGAAAGCGAQKITPPATTATAAAIAIPTATPSPAGGPPHILVIMDENSGYAATLGSCGGGSPDPYLCSLASKYASATDWYAVEHPSLPNYIDTISGSDQGCTSDTCVGAGTYSAEDLGGQLTAAGIPWTAFMESMPSPCYTGATSGDDSTGAYALKHDPFAVFDDNLSGACHILPYPGASGLVSALDGANASDFVWITPNLCDDGHDDCGPGNVQQTDAWLNTNLPGVLSSSWFHDSGTVIITLDENDDQPDDSCCGDAAGGQVPEVVISSAATGMGDVALTGDHFGTLRTIEEAYGLPLLGAADLPANGDLTALLG